MKHLKNRTSGDPESIKLFKKSVYSDENFNLFVVMICSSVSIINALFLSLKSFNPYTNVSACCNCVIFAQ